MIQISTIILNRHITLCIQFKILKQKPKRNPTKKSELSDSQIEIQTEMQHIHFIIVIQYPQRFNKRTKSVRNSQMKTEVKVGVLTVCRRRVTVRPTNRPHRSSPREMCRLFPETRSPVDDHRYSRHTGDSALTSS
jgi:hypothetical protein